MTEHCDVMIVGGGGAGISAAKALWAAGCRSAVLVERRDALGGILLQCVHPGFGPDLDGRAYAAQLLRDFPADFPCLCGVTVTALRPDRTALLSDGRAIRFRALILAAGCREIPFGALPVAGTRPRGVYTAGQMQELVNCRGFRPRGPAVILGSGDVGLVMAWQLAALGLEVSLVERQDAMTGLARNRERLAGLPVRFLPCTTVREIRGWPEITGVSLSDGQVLPCRTLLSAVGLRPELELLPGGKRPDWLVTAGNCSRIHARIESVLRDGAEAAARALALLSRGL